MRETLFRLLTLLTVFLLLARFAPWLGWLLVVLSLVFVVLWWLRAVGRLPPALVGPIQRLDALLPGRGGSPPPRPGPSPTPGNPPAPPAPQRLSQRDRDRMFAQAEGEIARLQGVEGVVGQVQARLLDLAEDARQRRRPGFGILAPGIVAVLSGPQGVGKSALARQFAPLFCGQGAFEHDRCEVMTEDEAGGRAYGESLAPLVQQRAEASLGGVLLLEDADWLTETDPAGGPMAGVEAIRTLLRVAEQAPGRLFVVLTMTGAGARRLLNDARVQQWLNKLQVESFEFPDRLDDGVLYRLLTDHLTALGLEVEDEAQRPLRGRIKTLRQEQGQQFDNANAMRRLADRVAQRVAQRAAEGPAGGPRRVSADDIRRL